MTGLNKATQSHKFLAIVHTGIQSKYYYANSKQSVDKLPCMHSLHIIKVYFQSANYFYVQCFKNPWWEMHFIACKFAFLCLGLAGGFQGLQFYSECQEIRLLHPAAAALIELKVWSNLVQMANCSSIYPWSKCSDEVLFSVIF